MSRRDRRSVSRWHGKDKNLAMNGGAGNRLGSRNEDRVLAILEAALVGGVLPGWITGVRPGTGEEDAVGKDLVVATNRGEIGVQVKSGVSSYNEFRRREGNDMIALVMVKKRNTDPDILKTVVSELTEIHGALEEGQ